VAAVPAAVRERTQLAVLAPDQQHAAFPGGFGALVTRLWQLLAARHAEPAPAEEMPLEQWQRVMGVNLTGVFLSCQAEARVMLPRKQGSIVNIASMSGTIVNRGILQVHYNSSKAAVIHLSKSLAMEWSDRCVRVNAISPGYTLTPMNLRPEVAEARKQFEADTPLGRMATVDELVGPAVFLSSQAASFCTGIDLIVDGGFVCW